MEKDLASFLIFGHGMGNPKILKKHQNSENTEILFAWKTWVPIKIFAFETLIGMNNTT